MEDLRAHLIAARDMHKVAWETIELDYILGWILTAISHHRVLGKSLIFKGGTALKKCWFQNYRGNYFRGLKSNY